MKPALSDEPTTNEVERVLVVDQRVLRGEQADIRVCDFQQFHDRFRPVHAEAPALDGPFLTHPRESREGALARNLELLLPRCVQIGIVGRKVVYEDHIERIKSEPLQTVLDRALHAIRRVVEDQVVRRRCEGKILLRVILPRSLEQLPHLGREDIIAAVLGVEEIAEPPLAQAETIPGRGVVVADTRAPRRFERSVGVLFRDDRELIAKWHAAQAEADRGLVVFRRSCLHDGLPFWYRGGVPPVPIRWLLVRDPTGELEAQAFLATDLNACPGDILAWFVSRWQVDLVLSGNHAFKVPDAGRSSVTAVTRAAGFDGNHQDERAWR